VDDQPLMIKLPDFAPAGLKLSRRSNAHCRQRAGLGGHWAVGST
jgi:hypothetical protein